VTTRMLTRRTLLAAWTLATLAPLTARASGARASERTVAAIDWGHLETCLALGIVPAAATELRQFRAIAVEPVPPPEVADLGLRGSPNIELLRMIAPGTILISDFYEYQRPLLERISPVVNLPVYQSGTPPYALAEQSTAAIGKLLGRETEVQAYMAAARAEIEAIGQRLGQLARHPVFVISLGDSRHFRAFGADSMFGDVIARLGLRNAWTDATSYSAAAPVGLEALARIPEASIAVIGPTPPEVQRTLAGNALWNTLPAVAQSRAKELAPINHFGALPSALRFARELDRVFGSQADAG